MSPTEKRQISRRQFLKTATILAGSAALTVGAASTYPVIVETRLVQRNHYQIPVPNLPKAFEGFKIAHLTDLHYKPLFADRFIQRVVRMTNRCNADLIVNTGDNVYDTNSTESIDAVWPLISKLSAPHGVYSVLGNHDHWANFQRSREWQQKTGQDLYKKSVKIERDGQTFWLGGAGDAWEDTNGIDQAFAKAPAKACKICLAHNPDTVDLAYQTQIDLFLCGHTHGGQILMPFLDRPLTNQQLPVRNKAYINGLVINGTKRVFISRGIGWAILPVRFNCAPEIAILELVTEKNNTHRIKDQFT